MVVVDTEEEFDWAAGFDRAATTVDAMAEIGRFQAVCDEFGVRPTYVCDFPVASQERGYAPLAEFRDAGRAEIGAHLHPWVNPPHDEEVTRAHSYAGNLPRDLERAKLVALRDEIARNLGQAPRVYKAGRYGVGPHTAALLEETGFDVDLSVAPPMDYRDDGGPDFRGFPSRPYWFGAARRLLELPVTGGYAGALGGWGGLGALAHGPFGRAARLPGILARLGLHERLRLTPEGLGFAENERLVRALLARGERVFQFSLHSPSLDLGRTSYVRTDADRTRLLDTCRRFFDLFLGVLGGRAATPLELKAEFEAAA